MNITLDREGNTQANTVRIGPITLYFSYQTLIAIAYPSADHHNNGGEAAYRSDQSYSNTTARHFAKLGCARFPMCTEAELDIHAENAITALGIDFMHRTLAQNSDRGAN